MWSAFSQFLDYAAAGNSGCIRGNTMFPQISRAGAAHLLTNTHAQSIHFDLLLRG